MNVLDGIKKEADFSTRFLRIVYLSRINRELISFYQIFKILTLVSRNISLLVAAARARTTS
jgi:hypothetical protein